MTAICHLGFVFFVSGPCTQRIYGGLYWCAKL